MAVDPAKAAALVATLTARGTPAAAIVGRIDEGAAGRMSVTRTK
jgi:hypothetical protein